MVTSFEFGKHVCTFKLYAVAIMKFLIDQKTIVFTCLCIENFNYVYCVMVITFFLD